MTKQHIEVITSVERRRRWSQEEKERLVDDRGGLWLSRKLSWRFINRGCTGSGSASWCRHIV